MAETASSVAGEGEEELTGTSRAAILLMALGEDRAPDILKELGPKEVHTVGVEMSTLGNISREQIRGILEGFIEEIGGRTALGSNSDDYIRSVLTKALGEDKAGGLIDRILMGKNSKGLESLKWMDASAVTEMIRMEHPQVISIVLSYLEADHAAEIIIRLPSRTRSDVIMRIATLEGIQPSALYELDNIIEVQTTGSGGAKTAPLGGVRVAANILNFVGSSFEGEILGQIEEADAELGQLIEEQMFVFDNLIDMDDRSVQTLLRDVTGEALLMAIKGADENLKDKFLRNMSKRAADMLLDDLEAKGPVKLSEVEVAQKEILSVARKLSDSGEISLGGSGGEEYV